MQKETLLKKLNFGNGNYYLSYCLRPIACIKVAKKPLSEEVKNNLILKFKKNLIGESKTKLFFNFSANENKTINNLKSNNFKFIDDSIQFNKSIFEIDFSTEIYFKMGGEIEFIKIFN